MNKNEMVVHHNYLNESKFPDFTELELNLFITILYKMRHEKENEVVFKSEDIKNMTNAKDRSYKEFERILHSLQDRTFYLKTLSGYERIKPFPTLIFDNDKKNVTVEVNKRMTPIFRELKEQFTQYSLKEFVSLGNKYGKRLYQLLKQYESIGKRVIKLDDFRQYLDCTNKSYDKMSNLDKKVLIKAKDDINKNTSLNIEYIKIKKGRKVENIEFKIDKATPSDFSFVLPKKISELTLEGKSTSKNKPLCNKKNKKIKDLNSNKTTPSDFKDTPSDKLSKEIVKAKKNIYVSKAWNKRVDNKILKILNENGEDYALDILKRLYVSVKQDIKTTLVQYINGIMKNIKLEEKEKTKKLKSPAKAKKEVEKIIQKEILVKQVNQDITFEEFEILEPKTKKIKELEALEITIKEDGISELFLLNLKKKSPKLYFNTIKKNVNF